MEVFLRNLPRHIMDEALQKQLQPYMNKLSIVDYQAEKQRNKDFGVVTFLHEKDGKAFLRHHGEVPLPATRGQLTLPGQSNRKRSSQSTQARLTLMGRPIYCRKSDRKPNQYALKVIKQTAEQRHQANHETPAEATKVLNAVELSCGHYTFENGRLIFTAEWTTAEECRVRFTKRSLRITMTNKGVELRIPFQGIVELVWWEDGTAAVTLFWGPTILTSPPGGQDLLVSTFQRLGLGGSPSPFSNGQSKRLQAIDSQHGRISPYCFVYHFRVPNPVVRHAASDFESEMHRAGRNQFFTVTRYNLGFRYADGVSFDLARKSLWDTLSVYNTRAALPFGHLFLLQALVTNGYLHPTTVSGLAAELVRRFELAKKAGQAELPVSVEAFKKLFDWIVWPAPDGDPSMFEVEGIVERLEEFERQIREGINWDSGLSDSTQGRTQIFKAVVTPTAITLHGPDIEPMNRVLRKYSDHSYFIKAQFCDENGQDLHFSSKVSLDVIYDRFKSILSNGIQVAGRVYQLLGFSHSSLRAHAAWLTAPFVYQGELLWRDRIISNLGDFNGIQSPARRAARIGQAFSETPYAVDLDQARINVVKICDVERNGRVFSDGVGTISPTAASAIHKVIPRRKGLPTCFQIRWGGAKGMLSLDQRLEGNKICIRPSMTKFQSNDLRYLEICDMASEPAPMVLNRQLIKIFEDMGAPGTWFLNRQREELERLRGITATVYNTACFLRSQKIGESIQLYKLLRNIEAMDLDYRRDRFLRGVVEVVLLKELRLLKHKARIPVHRGMTLFGVMDETGYLDEGEVYVTYDADGCHCEPPNAGPCIISRSPALHPGDVQIAHNLIPPEDHPLSRLRNCIVFSQRGYRDLPSQLSGGDLDGDVFHVIWEPELVRTVRTFQPAEYARIAPLELSRPVELGDIAAFFVDFMKTDHLGVIATRHMILADQKDNGTLDPDCIKLAEFHSAAVDFSKTGRAVELSQLPRGLKWRPDFLAGGRPITIHDKSVVDMEEKLKSLGIEDDEDEGDGPRHKYYASDRILGLLYRAVDEDRIWADDIKTAVPETGSGFWEHFTRTAETWASTFGPVDWRRRADEARQIRYTYQDAMRSLMTNFAEHPNQPLRELEVFVGFIVNRTGVQTHRQRDRSVKLKDEFELLAAWITRELRKPAPLGGQETRLDGLELCLACLYADAESEVKPTHPGRSSLGQNVESFRVVAASALVCELNALEGGYFPKGLRQRVR
ncbi:hypothetical protein VTJ83DRAFT_6215 [Remersonia thermophila]|uniref:RNA-dependent RNA polymerase n=1 Tax=Remersonia thermophila TaxID=72144 RepID=A0ABR4D472_9PEZI